MELPKEYFQHVLFLLLFKSRDFNVNNKSWKFRFVNIIGRKSSTIQMSELARELNIDRTTVIKRLRDMLFK